MAGLRVKFETKLTEAVSPQLEDDEQVQRLFQGQRPLSPLAGLFVGQILFIFILQFKTVVATDRNVYVFSNRWMRGREFKEEPPLKVPLPDARIQLGRFGSLRVGDGPKIYVYPFGYVWRQAKALASYAENAQTGTRPPV
jgi:hypothetical protein